VGDNVLYMAAGITSPKWPNWPPPRVEGTAWALAYISFRSNRTAAGVGVVRGSSCVRGSWGRVENVVAIVDVWRASYFVG
jgi:hypothetical protein